MAVAHLTEHQLLCLMADQAKWFHQHHQLRPQRLCLHCRCGVSWASWDWLVYSASDDVDKAKLLEIIGASPNAIPEWLVKSSNGGESIVPSSVEDLD